MDNNIFNPNNYTEDAMPLTTALCRMLDSEDLGMVSDNIKNERQKKRESRDAFYAALTEEQESLLIEADFERADEQAINNREYFNRGFKLGVILMKELFG